MPKYFLFSLLILISTIAESQTCRDNFPKSNHNDYYDNDGVVIDFTTNLIWKKCSEGQTWNSSTNLCDGTVNLYTWTEALVHANSSIYLGNTSWRVPNIKELESLAETSCISPSIDSKYFPSASSTYWSSSPLTYGAYAWITSNTGGINNISKNNKVAIRLVRNMVEIMNVVKHNGFNYGIVVSPTTGRKWLNRNLGATQSCSVISNPSCIGDYYQWGRGSDGHEKSNSPSTSSGNRESDLDNTSNRFITSRTSYPATYDWLEPNIDDTGSIRTEKWSSIDGSSICPKGFYVPSQTDWTDENIELDNAIHSFLRIPQSGFRDNETGNLRWVGVGTNIYTSSPLQGYKTYGKPVRCIAESP